MVRTSVKIINIEARAHCANCGIANVLITYSNGTTHPSVWTEKELLEWKLECKLKTFLQEEDVQDILKDVEAISEQAYHQGELNASEDD